MTFQESIRLLIAALRTRALLAAVIFDRISHSFSGHSMVAEPLAPSRSMVAVVVVVVVVVLGPLGDDVTPLFKLYFIKKCRFV